MYLALPWKINMCKKRSRQIFCQARPEPQVVDNVLVGLANVR